MLFNSTEFLLVFLPLAILGYIGLRRLSGLRHVYIWLTVCSLFFYYWWKPSMGWVIVCSIGVNFVIGRLLVTRATTHLRKLLFAGIAANLLPLFYYKYSSFAFGFAASLLGGVTSWPEILLPLGISFFTFQQITFLVDAYKGDAPKYGFFEYSTFVMFFPQLIAGPIVHHGEMMSQFGGRRPGLYGENLGIGAGIFIIGLFKKVVIADSLAEIASPVFEGARIASIDFLPAWAGALAYTFQLYFDFSGYSDMAIGLARMFGILLPVNFLSPYKATSIVEFWRRWHITLSRFLRDYVYIPLGGNRDGEGRRYAYIMITMLIGGLWHGAGWTFIFWGALHGAYLVVNHFWNRSVHASRERRSVWGVYVSWAATFLCVVVGWVFFRAESFASALRVLEGMAMMGDVGEVDFNENYLPILAAAIVCFFGRNIAELFSNYEPVLEKTAPSKSGINIRFSPSAEWALALAILLYLSIAKMAGNHSSEFLYFNF